MLKLAEYVGLCAADPAAYAAIGIPAAAALLDREEATVRRMIADGRLDAVSVADEEGRARTYVLVVPLHEMLRARDQERADQIDTLTASLEDAARKEEAASYGELMAEIGLHWRQPSHRKRTGVLLAQISKRSRKDRGCLLSVLAVRKNTGRPNDQFFELAAEMGLLDEDDDRDDFLAEQRRLVFARYGGGKRTAAKRRPTAG